MIEQSQVVEYVRDAKRGELRSLIDTLESELGFTASLPQFIVPRTEPEPEKEQTEFDVVLTGFTGKKVAVIQAVRKLTGLGLRESKKVVEDAPTVLKEAVSAADAKEAAEALAAADGTVKVC